MTLIIVYVGAVAVLFLFVVMMLNINDSLMKEGFLNTFLWVAFNMYFFWGAVYDFRKQCFYNSK